MGLEVMINISEHGNCSTSVLSNESPQKSIDGLLFNNYSPKWMWLVEVFAQFGVIASVFSFLNYIWWFRYLVLNSVAVRPTYVSVFSSEETLAW